MISNRIFKVLDKVSEIKIKGFTSMEKHLLSDVVNFLAVLKIDNVVYSVDGKVTLIKWDKTKSQKYNIELYHENLEKYGEEK